MDAAADLQEEEGVKGLEPDRLHGEEVDRKHLFGVLVDELPRNATGKVVRRNLSER